MFHCMEKQYFEQVLHKSYAHNKQIDIQYGEKLFLDFAQDVMSLSTTKRQHGDQLHFMDLLEKARCEHKQKLINEEDARFLCSFHIQQNTFTSEIHDKLINDPQTMFLYAFNSDKDKCNEQMLFRQHSKDNPVAVIKTATTNKYGATISNNSKHFNQTSNILHKTIL